MTPDTEVLRKALERARSLSDAATPGRWSVGMAKAERNGLWADDAPTQGPDEDGEMGSLIAWFHSDWRDEADAAFAAAAVNYVRAALATADTAPAIRCGICGADLTNHPSAASGHICATTIPLPPRYG